LRTYEGKPVRKPVFKVWSKIIKDMGKYNKAFVEQEFQIFKFMRIDIIWKKIHTNNSGKIVGTKIKLIFFNIYLKK
jgi:hypothetical protein